MTDSQRMGTSAYYFAYGSNMNPARMLERQISFHKAQAGTLHGYHLTFNKRSTLQIGMANANVMPVPNCLVEGVVYHLKDDQEILKMDVFEGFPTRYDRRPLPVTLAEQGEVNAWVYIADPAYIDNALKPARWYLDHLLAGKHYLSDSYYKGLLKVPCLD